MKNKPDSIVLTDLQIMCIAEQLMTLNRPQLDVKVHIPLAALDNPEVFYFSLEVPKEVK